MCHIHPYSIAMLNYQRVPGCWWLAMKLYEQTSGFLSVGYRLVGLPKLLMFAVFLVPYGRVHISFSSPVINRDDNILHQVATIVNYRTL
jgi:hypothetical protein